MSIVKILILVSIGACFLGIQCALPKSAWNCDDEKIDSKYYNESCKADDECFGRSRSMICDNGICQCAENFVPEERFVGEAATQIICVSAPYLFSPCKTICQKPAVCKPYSGSDAKLKDQKVCQCEAPYKLEDGVCHIECKEDEYYDSGKYKCIPKCKVNEISVNDTCYPVANLKDKCEINKQCQPAFSECKEKVCVCLPGFLAQDGLCAPEMVSCPNGEVLKANNAPTKCTILRRELKGGKDGDDEDDEDKPRSIYELYDDCPETHFCSMIGGAYRSENNTGYCCPKAKPQCPVGKPLEGIDCRSYGSQKQCPWDTHYCHSVGNGDEKICCPKQCDSNMILENGKCYARARLGDACSIGKQCSDSYTDCASGKCQCSNGAVEIKSATYKYCSHKCKENEILHEKKCHTPLSLGDSCKGQKWRCPTNSFCNKHHVCSCSCPRFTLSKDVCAPVPVCPGIRRLIAYRAAMLNADSEVKSYAPISDAKRKELLANVTFCSIPDKQSPSVEKVEKCPDGQYCAQYINNLGVCCKKPEPVCPNGKRPASVGKCEPRNPLSCGLNKYCYEYLYTADPNSDDGRICCEHEGEEEQ